MKDHYKILGIKPSATLTEVKKAYRKLAMQYHPDKNPDNEFAQIQFIEVQEAYTVLSNPIRREKYDDERWMNSAGKRSQYVQEVTPSWLLSVSIDMNKSLSAMDTHRISHRALQAYILLILSDAHIGVLRNFKDTEKTELIIAEVIKAMKWLDIRYLDEIIAQLLKTTDDLTQQRLIYQYYKGREKEYRLQKSLPYLMMLVTAALCVAMYYYSKK